jgi:methylated-DNA-[protein]-cysteine S-methyltransferase
MTIELRRCVLPHAPLEFVCASSARDGLLAADWLERDAPRADGPGAALPLPSGLRAAIDRARRQRRDAPVIPPFDPLDFLRDPQVWRAPDDVPQGSEHARRVWRALCRIPVGETRTYGEIAREIGSSPRAVGQACRANPWPLFVPCHRVVPGRGARTPNPAGAYAGQLEGPLAGVKAWLLEHEASAA